MDVLLVLPNWYSDARLGSTQALGMASSFSIVSITPRPPVWMHMCSNAFLKSGV
jgi:hypothetical protein